jgi:hypothetical protein
MPSDSRTIWSSPSIEIESRYVLSGVNVGCRSITVTAPVRSAAAPLMAPFTASVICARAESRCVGSVSQ